VLSCRSKKNAPPTPHIEQARPDEMIEQATVNCYNESEQISGWFTMIEDNLAVPFETVVLGVPLTVESVELGDNEQIVAVYRRGRNRQLVPILELSPPNGAEWIEAYRNWLGEGER
jgi:hypothetical protein